MVKKLMNFIVHGTNDLESMNFINDFESMVECYNLEIARTIYYLYLHKGKSGLAISRYFGLSNHLLKPHNFIDKVFNPNESLKDMLWSDIVSMCVRLGACLLC